MSDIDALLSRGIPYRCLVDGQGVAVGGTRTIAQLKTRGFNSICQVDAVGVAADTSTLAQLRSRGIPAFCAVGETGVESVASATSQAIRNRGMLPMCAVSALGVALDGTATIAQLRQRGIGYFCPLDEGGTATTLTDTSAPGAVVLTWDTVTSDSTPGFDVDLPSGNGAPLDAAVNDILEVELAPGVAYLSDTLDAGEVAGDTITKSGVTPLANGSYATFRARLTRGAHLGPWSTVVNGPVVVSVSSTSYVATYISSGQY